MSILSGKTYFFFLVFIFSSYSMTGQIRSDLDFIDSLTQIIVNEKQGSPEQEGSIEELRQKLISSTELPDLTTEEKWKIHKNISNLTLLSGVFSVVKEPRYNQDTSDKLTELQAELEATKKRLQDIQDDLIGIADAEDNNPKDREKAVDLLATIKNPVVLEFLFANEERLRFGKFNTYDKEGDWQRTTLRAILKNYTAEDRWLLVPALMQHLKTLDYSEIYLLHRYAEMYPDKEGLGHLYRFMSVNSSEESKAVIDAFIKNWKF